MRVVALLYEGPHDKAVVIGLLERVTGRPPFLVGEYRWGGIHTSLPKGRRRATRQFRQKCGPPPHNDGIRVLEFAWAVWHEQNTPDVLLIAVRDRDGERARCDGLEWAARCLGEERVVWGCAIECVEAWVLARLALDAPERPPELAQLNFDPLKEPERVRCGSSEAPSGARFVVGCYLGGEVNREGYRLLFAGGYDVNALVRLPSARRTGLTDFVTRTQAVLFRSD